MKPSHQLSAEACREHVKSASEEYVRVLSACKRRWELHATGDLSADYEKRKLIASLTAMGNPFKAEDIEKEFGIELTVGRDSMIQLGRILMESLTQDVADCLHHDQLQTLERCQIRMVDIGETNALCSNQAFDGARLPGYIILVNQGLYFCVKLLVTAQIYEDMQGDFAKYKRPGNEVFSAACDLYLTESPEMLNVGAVFTGNEEVDGAIEAHVSLGSVLLMQFVVLHEIGHAHLGHNETLKYGRLSALAAAGQHEALESLKTYHEAEYEADEFAWNALAFRANDSLKNLGNLYVIRLFFGFLSIIEKKLGKSICPYHPSPKQRLEKLQQLFAPSGLSTETKELFERQDSLLVCWGERII